MRETILCDHLEMREFGEYRILYGDKEQTATLMKCNSCGKFLTLDNQEIYESNILPLTSSTARESMRTVIVQLNNDIYERIEDLIGQKGTNEDRSKIMNELLALGLCNYRKISPKF